MSNTPPSPPNPAKRQPRTSALAVTALVFAVIPCCPFINLAGATAGIAALRRIDRSGGALGGRRIAKAAILVGLALSVLLAVSWMMFTVRYQKHVDAQMNSIAIEFFDAAAQGKTAQARQILTADAQQKVDDGALTEFGAEVAQRYGRLSRISFSLTSGAGSLLEPSIDAACVYTFDSSRQTGAMRFRLIPSGNSVWPTVKLVGVRIDDDQRGDLNLGIADETP